MTSFQRLFVALTLASLLGLTACTPSNVLTIEEIKIQNAADRVVAETLFERGLENTASYHVRKDGFVALHFDKSVTDSRFTDIVNTLRADPAISGVYAEQEGKEVCPLK